MAINLAVQRAVHARPFAGQALRLFSSTSRNHSTLTPNKVQAPDVEPENIYKVNIPDALNFKKTPVEPEVSFSNQHIHAINERDADAPLLPQSYGQTLDGVRSALSRCANPLVDHHVLSSKQFVRSDVEAILEVANVMHELRQTHKSLDIMRGWVLGSLFFEPSTRTSSSFNTAMLRLGGNVSTLNAETSSHQKGETLEDTIKVMTNYTDVTVMRHPEVGSVARAASISPQPVLNAGDGKGEHPTQALLDLLCIQKELERPSLDGLNVTMIGDLRNGRTVHSLSRLLSLFEGVTINYVAPEALRMPAEYVEEYAQTTSMIQHEMTDYAEALKNTDVVYMTRVQKERFDDPKEYEQCKGMYVLTPDDLVDANPEMAILHPLPRVDEIDVRVDDDPRAAYFRQAGYGLSTRMALLAMVTGNV